MFKQKFSKKGDEDASKSYSFLIKVLLAILVGAALYFMIKRIGYAFLPK